MAQFLLDTMTASDGTTLQSHTGETGATWTKLITTDNATIFSNMCFASNAGSGVTAQYYASGSPANADYEVSADVVPNTPGNQEIIGLFGRIQTATTPLTAYCWRYNASGTPQYELYLFGDDVGGAGVDFLLLGTYVATISGTTTIKLRMVGTSIKGYVAGVERASATNGVISTAGKAGAIWHDSQSSHTSNLAITSISGDDVSAGATAFTLTGPSRGPAGAASADFTYTPTGGSYSGTITPSGTGCTFTPSSLTWSGTSEAKTVTANRAAGSSNINGTGSPSLTQPSNVAYEAVATTTGNFAYQDATPNTATTYQVMNDDNTGFQNEASAGTSSSLGTGSVSGVTIPADYEGRIEFRQGDVVATDVLTPPESGGNLPPLGGLLITRG